MANPPPARYYPSQQVFSVSQSDAGLPYGADNYAVTARDGDGNPTTIVFKQGTMVVKTRTITYTDGKLTTSADT